MSKLLLSVMGAFAEFERSLLSGHSTNAASYR